MRDTVKAVIIVQATPFNTDGSLDLRGLRANTRFLIDECKGRRFVLVPTGSTGKTYTLSDAGRIKVIETVIDTVAGALPVCGRGLCPRDRASVWSTESRDAEGHPIRDEGSVTHFAAHESAAVADAGPQGSEFAKRTGREAQWRVS